MSIKQIFFEEKEVFGIMTEIPILPKGYKWVYISNKNLFKIQIWTEYKTSKSLFKKKKLIAERDVSEIIELYLGYKNFYESTLTGYELFDAFSVLYNKTFNWEV